MPRFGPQDWRTPPDFLRAVEGSWNAKIRGDLACTEENNVLDVRASDFQGPPPFLTEEEDSLTVDWAKAVRAGRFGPLGQRGLLWCNPPFRDLRPWVRKAEASARHLPSEWYIALLCPASLSTRWASEEIFNDRDGTDLTVHLLRPRLTFVGATHPYPKDLMMLVFGPSTEGNTFFVSWNWRTGEMRWV